MASAISLNYSLPSAHAGPRSNAPIEDGTVLVCGQHAERITDLITRYGRISSEVAVNKYVPYDEGQSLAGVVGAMIFVLENETDDYGCSSLSKALGYELPRLIESAADVDLSMLPPHLVLPMRCHAMLVDPFPDNLERDSVKYRTVLVYSSYNPSECVSLGVAVLLQSDANFCILDSRCNIDD